MKKTGKVLGLFELVMINILVVGSLRALPIYAEYGLSLIFFFVLGALFFMIPSALVCSELETGWPKTGGIYVWIREAFGKKTGLIVIWLNWIYNVIAYPAILAMIAGTFAYLINPNLAQNNLYIFFSILILFWLATLFNCLGMKLSGIVSTLGGIFGIILPMLFIVILGIVWIIKGEPVQITFAAKDLVPDLSHAKNLAFLSSLLFGLLGLEMTATHAKEMKDPKKDYPLSLLISVIFIVTAMCLASLAIAIVIPKSDLHLATGIIQAFATFLQAFHLDWLLYVIVFLIVLSGFAGVAAWVIGPTKGLLVASEDGSLPKFLTRKNRYGMPINILIVQAVIVSILSLLFVFTPTVNSSFWILTDLTAQLALLVYIFLFLAAIKLKYSKPNVERSFKVPGNKLGMWFFSLLGILTSVCAIIFGFFPPAEFSVGNIWFYETVLIGGMILFTFIPLTFKR